MTRLFIFGIISFGLLVAACSKSKNSSNESALYGAWVNSNAPNDTLWFVNKGGKNIMRLNNSFNTGAPAYAEFEYFFINGALSFNYGGPAGAIHLANSFTWKQENRQFEILIYQLYLFVSSTVTHGLYTKIG